MALEHYIIATFYHMEVGIDRLIVGDTLGVSAFHDAYDVVGKSDGVLINYFVSADNVDFGVRRDKGDAVECLFGEEHVGNFDNAFFPALLAVEIEANSHTACEILDTKQIHHLKKRLGGNMVDNRSIFEGSNSQFRSEEHTSELQSH